MAQRLTPKLRRRVLDLPILDRIYLLEQLRSSIQVPGSDRLQRLSYLAEKMQEVSGVDIREARDRKAGTVWPRNIFIFVARREGYQQNTIGEMIGRDHSSVCAAEQRVNDAFSMPDQYRDEINLYNKFVDSL